MNKLLPNADFAVAGNDIVLKVARERVQQYLDTLQLQFAGKFSLLSLKLSIYLHLNLFGRSAKAKLFHTY
mgnify:CR=1 FL=1